MEKNTLYLTHELIIQILLRLPVKSLIRLKCVCKSWFSLISDPNFANSHFQLTATHTRRILFISTSPTETRSIDFEASLNDDSVSLNRTFMLPEFHFNLQIKGSCRGFIFLRCSSNIFYLWNPSTGFHKQIPMSPIDSNSSLYVNYFYGFGYDQLKDDYLIISMSYDPKSVDVNSHVWVFSLRANTWKEIVGTTHLPYLDFSCFDYSMESFNGSIHWLTFHHDTRAGVIVGFHCIERELFEILLPYDVGYDSTECDLWVYRGFLSLWAIEDDTMEIWVMKEYKVCSSWIKTHVLPIDGIPIQIFYPVCCTTCGDIVGTDGRIGLVKYNDKGQLLERRSYSNDAREPRVAMYTESLLSLPCDNEQA